MAPALAKRQWESPCRFCFSTRPMIAPTEKRVEAVGPKVLGRFLDKIGGAEAFGDTIVEDFTRARQRAIASEGKDHQIEKRLDAFRKDILTKLVDIDRFHHETGEFDDVSDEELANLLMEQAIEKITANPMFAARLLGVVRDQQPAMWQQLVVTGEVPEPAHVIDVTFDSDGYGSPGECAGDNADENAGFLELLGDDLVAPGEAEWPA